MNVVATRRLAGADAAGMAPVGAMAGDFRAVHRAIGELRRGTPVLLAVDGSPSVALAVETLGEASLAEFVSVAAAPMHLLLDAGRVLHGGGGGIDATGAPIVAVPIAEALLQPRILLGMADPTAVQVLSQWPASEPAPAGAEAALTLAKLARLLPAMLVAPLDERGPTGDLLGVAASEVLEMRATAEAGLARISAARVPLQDAADCRVVAFRNADAGPEHLAILVGAPETIPVRARAPLARIHSECFTGDLLGSLRCDCGPQLRGAIRRMAEEGAGVLLYLAQEGRGIGLANKLRAYALQDAGLDTLDANRALGWGADERGFAAAASMLRALGITRVRLLTNNPKKLGALAEGGITVERVSHLVAANGVNDAYLATKADRFGHLGA